MYVSFEDLAKLDDIQTRMRDARSTILGVKNGY